MTKKIETLLIAFFYSIFITIIGPMTKEQTLDFQVSALLPFAICFAVCFIVLLLCFNYLPKIPVKIENNRFFTFIRNSNDKRFLLVIWAVIFSAWVPAFLVLFPGVLSYDIIAQTNSAFGQITSNHHPVLHTWLLRVFMRLGDALCSSKEVGLGLLSLMQMLLLSFSLAKLVTLLKKKGVPVLMVLLTALFSAAWFMNAVLAVTMIKDTLHAAFFVLFAVHFTEIVTAPQEYISRKRNYILLLLIGFFMCATRNNGFHIYVFCFALLFVLRIRKIKEAKRYLCLVVAIVIPLVTFKVYSGPVFRMLGIEQGQVREALCIPIQQLQRVAVYRGDELTDAQMELMDYYIDNLKWREPYTGREYDPFMADPAKSSFYSNSYEADPVAFWKFYFQIGLQFSKEYINAFLSNTLGYWYPGYYDYSYVMYENYSSDSFLYPLERHSLVDSEALGKYYESRCLSTSWRETPVVRLLFVSGFAPWILLCLFVMSCKKGNVLSKSIPIFLPLIAQFGIMILSPMSSFRYSWPLYLLLPITFIGIWGKEDLTIADK